MMTVIAPHAAQTRGVLMQRTLSTDVVLDSGAYSIDSGAVSGKKLTMEMYAEYVKKTDICIPPVSTSISSWTERKAMTIGSGFEVKD